MITCKFENNKSLNVVIRADGNSQIGLGHIVRTMALANEFKSNGHKVFYIVKEDFSVIELLKSNKFEIIKLDSNLGKDLETEEINKILEDYSIDVFIGDSEKINQEYLKQIHRNNRLIVLIDVLRDMSLDADLIINGGIYANSLKAEADKYDRNALLGVKYNLLREQFIDLPKVKKNKNVKNILVTMGGSDICNFTPVILRSISELNEMINIDVIIGNSFRIRQEIEEIVQTSKNINLYYNVKNMAELMLDSDIAISAGGTTLYELATTGTPTIALMQAENQRLQLEKFQEIGTILWFKKNPNIETRKFKEYLNILIKDNQKRISMSNLGQQKVDAKGPKRCYESIIKLYNSNL